MTLKQEITLTNITEWCVVFFILFYLFAINSNLNKIQDKMNSFVMFPLEMTQAGKKYEYIGNLSVKKLSKKGLIDISNFDLIIIREIEGEQYQGFYKEIKETNE